MAIIKDNVCECGVAVIGLDVLDPMWPIDLDTTLLSDLANDLLRDMLRYRERVRVFGVLREESEPCKLNRRLAFICPDRRL